MPRLRYKKEVKRPATIIVLLLLLLGGFISYWRWSNWREHSQDGPILRAAAHYGVDPALVKAVVWRESCFNPGLTGRAGEIGLMQVIPKAAGKDWADAEHLGTLNPEHLFDPVTNTLAGTWYLQKLLKRYARTDNPLPYALADYNAGRGNVLKWGRGAAATNSEAFIEQIGFPSTKSYVKTVTRRYEHYRPMLSTK